MVAWATEGFDTRETKDGLGNRSFWPMLGVIEVKYKYVCIYKIYN